MKKQWCLFLMLLIFSVWAVAGRSPNADKKKWLQSELNLTHEQSVKIKKILRSYEKRLSQQMADLELLKNDMRKTFRTTRKGETHKMVLLKKFEEVQKARYQKHETRFLMALEIREVLTVEQIEKMNSLKEFKKTE